MLTWTCSGIGCGALGALRPGKVGSVTVVVLTGATRGIGRAAAIELVRRGAEVALVGRDPERVSLVAEEAASVGSGRVHCHVADLALMSNVRVLADEIRRRYKHVDVLANNAGALFASRKETPEGFEQTFALNHLAPFLLTNLLRDRLAGGRVVTTASGAHKSARLDLEDLQSERSYSPRVYGVSKLCNILFTRELARRLRGSAVTTNCLHPGFVATRFGDESGGLISGVIGFAKLFAISPAQGADTIVHLASAPEVAETSGEYFYRRRPATPTAAARDDRAALALWQRSAALAGIEE